MEELEEKELIELKEKEELKERELKEKEHIKRKYIIVMELREVGLSNTHDTCYANAGFQLLRHIPQIHDLLIKYNRNINTYEEGKRIIENTKAS